MKGQATWVVAWEIHFGTASVTNHNDKIAMTRIAYRPTLPITLIDGDLPTVARQRVSHEWAKS